MVRILRHGYHFTGENFAVFRSEGGEVIILDAYCPHLGANLAVGGKVRGDCLECPFHGWVFDGHAGKCVSIPYSASKRKYFETSNILIIVLHSVVHLFRIEEQ